MATKCVTKPERASPLLLSHSTVHKMFPLLLFTAVLFYSDRVLCQNSLSAAIPWRSVKSCAENQYFNSISLSCVQCPSGQIPTPTHDDCQCAIGFRISGWSGGTLQCAPCTDNLAVSLDGWSCVECQSSEKIKVPRNPATGKCPLCRAHEISETREAQAEDVNGFEQCRACPSGSQPNADQSRCETCATAECFCQTNPDLCHGDSSPESASSSDIQLGESEASSFHSSYIAANLAYAESNCRAGKKRECQHLANLCVLQNYERSKNGACAQLESILRSPSNTQSSTMPLLFYYNTEAPIELSRESAIEAVFNVEGNQPNTELEIVSVMYSLNGTFLGIKDISDGLLQLCPADSDSLEGTFVFGREYHQECVLRLSNLLDEFIMKRSHLVGQQATIFHELYLRYVDQNNQEMMYPIPVLDENLAQQGQYVNRQQSDNRWILTRRFFLLDQQEEQSENGEQGKRLLRIPSLIAFGVTMQPSRDGHIYPILMRIRHKELLTDGTQKLFEQAHKTIKSVFKITYGIDSSRHDKTIEILMATFCSTSVLWGALRAYAWGRRAGKEIIDTNTMIKLVLYMADIIGNIFLVVIGCMAVWITFAYKLQKHMVYVMLSYNQEWSFIVYVSVALGLKALALAHLYATLILTETFFVDWERPRTTESAIKETHFTKDADDAPETKQVVTKPPVIWRTYLVANEWNELQNYRKTSIACQMLFMLLILDYFNFADFGIIQPGFARGGQPKEFAQSRLSRFAVNLTFYMLIGLGQWIVNVLIVEKVVDPFRNFMDLCSMANVSVFALTHPLRGYYIHGRSVHGLADTGMQDMNQFLKRERENLCGLRGLESNNELQTFVMNLPTAFRERYDQITAPLRSPTTSVNVRLSGNDKTTVSVENVASVYNELNQYLKELIEHSVPETDYVITDSKFIEEVLGLELTDNSKIGRFTRDPSEIAYSSVFVYGNEWSHLSFEMLLFCILDLVCQNRVIAATATYLISTVIQKIARVFFTNNLIKSSLVDSRFLI